MLLTVDVGNTQTHIGVFAGSELKHHWRIGTIRDATGDELGVILRNLLALKGLALAEIEGLVISSTVAELRPAWREMAEQYVGGEVLVVGPGLKSGIPIRINNPLELGSDRLVNAVAAYDRFQTACIVVDFGTAITFDAVSNEGHYLGGVIAPGVEISLSALSDRASALSHISIEEPQSVIGRSTEQAIRSGVVYGFAGLVDGIVARMVAELAVPAAKVIATGGYARKIVEHCKEVAEVDDYLTLSGLKLIWERNT
jgi:type III pantothenate kinase